MRAFNPPRRLPATDLTDDLGAVESLALDDRDDVESTPGRSLRPMLADGLRKSAVVVEDVVETSRLGGGLDGVNRVEGSPGAKELAL